MATVKLALYLVEWTAGTKVTVGNAGRGELRAQDMSVLDAPDVLIGQQADGDGTVILGGDGTELRAANITTGVDGQGHLEVNAGADVIADNLAIAQAVTARGSVVIQDPGSTISISNGIVIDGKGESEFQIKNGAVAISDFATIDYGGGIETFNAVVTGAGSQWTVNTLSIGTDSVNAGLLIEQGGRFDCTTECVVGSFTGFSRIGTGLGFWLGVFCRY